MKALCINSDWVETRRRLWGLLKSREVECDGPKCGDIVTAVGQYWDDGMLYYVLLEWPPCDNDNGWEANQFIPIESEERELQQSQILYIPY